MYFDDVDHCNDHTVCIYIYIYICSVIELSSFFTTAYGLIDLVNVTLGTDDDNQSYISESTIDDVNIIKSTASGRAKRAAAMKAKVSNDTKVRNESLSTNNDEEEDDEEEEDEESDEEDDDNFTE